MKTRVDETGLHIYECDECGHIGIFGAGSTPVCKKCEPPPFPLAYVDPETEKRWNALLHNLPFYYHLISPRTGATQ